MVRDQIEPVEQAARATAVVVEGVEAADAERQNEVLAISTASDKIDALKKECIPI